MVTVAVDASPRTAHLAVSSGHLVDESDLNRSPGWHFFDGRESSFISMAVCRRKRRRDAWMESSGDSAVYEMKELRARSCSE